MLSASTIQNRVALESIIGIAQVSIALWEREKYLFFGDFSLSHNAMLSGVKNSLNLARKTTQDTQLT